VTKMDMVWIAVASAIHPEIRDDIGVRKEDIHTAVADLFGESITPVMITRHLVNSVDRQADSSNPQRGGSRNRYLVRNEQGVYRLYKSQDGATDAWEKTGPTCPDPNRIADRFQDLIVWYQNDYIGS
jgi:hypothetical protein